MTSEYLLQKVESLDARLCALGWAPPATWDLVRPGKVTKLYAGRLIRLLPQYRTHLGLALSVPSSRNIVHDIRERMPIPDESLDAYQAEDVFEHIEYDEIPAIFEEIYRVLKPGGLFRFSVPDYRCNVYSSRAWRDENGDVLFDPGGGGRLLEGKVIEGGHVWFPVYESIRELFGKSRFASGGRIEYLHYTLADGTFAVRDIDYSRGFVGRTPDNDDRAKSPRRPLSIVVDAVRQ